MKRMVFLIVILLATTVAGQVERPATRRSTPREVAGRSTKAAQVARAYREAHEAAIIDEFTRFLAIPNLASDRENIAKNAEGIVEMFARRGTSARQLRIEGAPPLVIADLRVPGAKRTIAFYAHYDGQPVDPSQWSKPPWQPVIKPPGPLGPESRIYARSASDDKAPIIAMLAALDALRAASIKPSVNLRFVFEGEEEAGSPHLASYLEKFPEDTAADAWVLCDGPVHQSRRMQLYFGARGVTDVEVTTYGPLRPLHSGHYGNWAPNPIVALTHLIDSMRDADGRILIPGFYPATRLAHPKVVRLNWGAGYPPARTPLDLPIAKQMASIMSDALGMSPVRMPSLGGSIPMYLFQRGGRTPVIGLPIVNHDNNQHAANENVRMQNLRDGIEVFAALFAALQ